METEKYLPVMRSLQKDLHSLQNKTMMLDEIFKDQLHLENDIKLFWGKIHEVLSEAMSLLKKTIALIGMISDGNDAVLEFVEKIKLEMEEEDDE